MVTVQGSDGSDGFFSLLIPNRLLDECMGSTEMNFWLDHAVNNVYRLSAIMTYILSLLLLLYYYIDVLNELCMMLPAGVHIVCLQTSTGL